MTIEISPKPLPIRQKAFTITALMAFGEYLSTLTVEQRQFMQIRLNEVRLLPDQQEFLLTYPDVLNVVVVVSDDAPETAIIVPIFEHIVAVSPRMSLRILRDTDDLTMLEAAVDDLALDDENGIDLPLLFIFDEGWACQAQWGPQPESAEAYLDQWLGMHPNYESFAESDDVEEQDIYWQLTDQLLYEMRMWYNSALDKECIRELCELLATLIEEDN